MRLRCDSTCAGHACSIFLDWLGHHPGDHVAYEAHDPARPVMSNWPNDGLPSRGIPVYSGTARACPPMAPSAPGPKAVPSRPTRPDPYAYEITEWDLLPDA